jgi:putative membrane protein
MPTSWVGPTNQEALNDRTHHRAGQPGTPVAALDGPGWILMIVGMVAVWALVITAVVLAVRYLAGPRGTAAIPSGSGETRAEDVLAQRFARGEIDENEYRQRLSLLCEYP